MTPRFSHGRCSSFALPAILLVVLVTTPASSREPSGIDELQGRWKRVSYISHGKDLELTGTLEIKGDLLIETISPKVRPARFTIDTTSKPAKVDQVRFAGTANEMQIPGIFEVSPDRLVVCHPSLKPGVLIIDPASRPKSIDSASEPGMTRLDLVRMGPAPPEGSSIARMIEGRWKITTSKYDGKETKLPYKSESVWNIKDGTLTIEGKFIREYKLSLYQGSAKADLTCLADEREYRSIIDFDPARNELKIARMPKTALDQYPADFTSKPDNLVWVEEFKKDEAKKP
jgi:uncharacterized protein (TIGR03067 family)